MRMINLIVGDIRFQIKYGFYFVYTVLTAIYIIILHTFPPSWREHAAVIMIFSDPAAMGLFFMGAIILLEKSQRVLNALAISPVKVTEYIISKVVSLGLISVVVAGILSISVKKENLLIVLLATAMTSTIFTLLGLIAGAKIASLNQFLIATVPLEMIYFAPPILYLFGYSPAFLRFYPLNLCMSLIAGKYEKVLISIVIIFATIGILFFAAYRCTLKMWKSVGGVKL